MNNKVALVTAKEMWTEFEKMKQGKESYSLIY